MCIACKAVGASESKENVPEVDIVEFVSEKLCKDVARGNQSVKIVAKVDV